MAKLILLSLSLIAILVLPITLVEAGRLPPPDPEKELPPVVELSAEYIGKAVLVKWILPIEETQNNEAYKWVLQRQINGSGFIDIANGERDPNNKPLEEGREVNYFLDKVSRLNTIYEYKMFFVSVDGRDTTESQGEARVLIPKSEPQIYVGQGKVLETTRPLVPYNKPAIKAFNIELIPSTFAQSAGLNPLISSTLNPKNEPYLFSLTPLPNPDPTSECEQILEILYMQNANGGQSFEVYATILESQSIVRNQNLFESIPNSDKRIFNDMYLIPLAEQTIQDFENLEVQLDIDSSTELNPSDYRSLSIYAVNLYVPAGNSAC